MLEINQLQFFESILFESLGSSPKIEFFQAVAGGNFNNAVKLSTTQGTYFLKWNESQPVDMFEAEVQGLALLKNTGTVNTPEVIQFGTYAGNHYLLMEFLPDGFQEAYYWSNLGSSIARLHKNTHANFGLETPNYIGPLPQNNEWIPSGIDFFIEKRLKVQAGLAFYHNRITKYHLEKFEKFYEKLPELLPFEPPALLHGDLWSGNVLANTQGKATLIDPSVYYGLREAELAFTQLFGGFDTTFYEAYQEVYPLSIDYYERVPIYNLYPLLVHVNLFGASYLSGVERILDRFVA